MLSFLKMLSIPIVCPVRDLASRGPTGPHRDTMAYLSPDKRSMIAPVTMASGTAR